MFVSTSSFEGSVTSYISHLQLAVLKAMGQGHKQGITSYYPGKPQRFECFPPLPVKIQTSKRPVSASQAKRRLFIVTVQGVHTRIR